jgi:hypothetical protein
MLFYTFLAAYSAYVAHFVCLRDVWIRTQRVAAASRRATNLATHLPSADMQPAKKTGKMMRICGKPQPYVHRHKKGIPYAWQRCVAPPGWRECSRAGGSSDQRCRTRASCSPPSGTPCANKPTIVISVFGRSLVSLPRQTFKTNTVQISCNVVTVGQCRHFHNNFLLRHSLLVYEDMKFLQNHVMLAIIFCI